MAGTGRSGGGAWLGGDHLALLLSIAFGVYSMNTRIDALGARIDALETSFNARIDTLGADLNTRIEQVYQLLLPRER